MTLQYCDARSDSDVAQVAQLISWSFGSPVADASEWIDKRVLRSDIRLLKDGDRALACLSLIRMGQHFCGRAIPIIGIAGVAVAPFARGKGLAAQIMADALRETRAEGTCISSLYPATAHLYRKVGYELAGLRHLTTIDLRTIDVPRPPLEFRIVTREDFSKIESVYASRVRGHSGPLQRGPYVWGRVFHPRDGVASGFGAFRGDNLEGYVFYTQARNPRQHSDLSLTDFIWSTPDAALSLLAFLRDHRSIGDTARFFSPAHDPALMLLNERCFSVTLNDQWMIRITDVPAALSKRPYRADANMSLNVRIHDPLFRENNNAWRLSISGGVAVVEPARDADIEMDVRALASLFTSFATASELAAIGFIRASSATRLAQLENAFSGPAPWMYDMF